MGEAAMKTGSRYVAFGVRSLSVATGLDHTTVAAHLRALRDEDDPLVDLIENDRGLAGDLYQLRIPDEIAVRAAPSVGRPGKLHALRPVFRELGHPAAFVYEALEHSRAPERSFDLVTRTGLSRTAVYQALETLAAWNLVTPRDGRWVLVPGTSLHQLAEQFGCADTVRALVTRHRHERSQYRRALRIVDQHHESEPDAGRTGTCGHRNHHPTRKPSSSCWNGNSAPTPSPSAPDQPDQPRLRPGAGCWPADLPRDRPPLVPGAA